MTKFTVVLEGDKSWSPRLWAEITADNYHEADIQAKKIAANHGYYSWLLIEGHNLRISIEKYKLAGSR